MLEFKKILALIPNKFRWRGLALIFFLVVAGFFEMIGLALVIPLLIVLTNPHSIYDKLQGWGTLKLLGNPGIDAVKQMVLVGFMVFYVVKTIYLYFVTKRTAKFQFGINEAIAQDLFMGYLKLPYSFHINTNSAFLVQNIINEINLFVFVIQNLLNLQKELFFVFFVTLLLFVREPVATTMLCLLIIGFGVFYNLLVKKKLVRWGNIRQEHALSIQKELTQSFAAIKDIKVSGKEKYFYEEFRAHNSSLQRTMIKVQSQQIIPRLMIELVLVMGIVALFLVKSGDGASFTQFMPTLALIVATAFRLIPSASAILSANQAMRYAKPVTKKLNDEFTLIREYEQKAAQQPENGEFPLLQHEIAIRDLHLVYEGSNKEVLKNIQLKIKSGEVIGFIGGSGAGKSTLVDAILGLIDPNNGYIRVDGIDIHTNKRLWQNQVGYIPQTITLIDDTIKKNVAFGLNDEEIDPVRLEQALDAAHLSEIVRSLSNGIDTIVGERGVKFSGGQRQRIGIARALYHQPKVLILDEATSSLDVKTEENIMNSVLDLRGEKTILIVAHRLSTVRHCDRIYVLKEGRIISEGNPSEVLVNH